MQQRETTTKQDVCDIKGPDQRHTKPQRTTKLDLSEKIPSHHIIPTKPCSTIKIPSCPQQIHRKHKRYEQETESSSIRQYQTFGLPPSLSHYHQRPCSQGSGGLTTGRKRAYTHTRAPKPNRLLGVNPPHELDFENMLNRFGAESAAMLKHRLDISNAQQGGQQAPRDRGKGGWMSPTLDLCPGAGGGGVSGAATRTRVVSARTLTDDSLTSPQRNVERAERLAPGAAEAHARFAETLHPFLCDVPEDYRQHLAELAGPDAFDASGTTRSLYHQVVVVAGYG